MAERSGTFMIFFQATGLCDALRLAAQAQLEPGPATVSFMKKLIEGAKGVAKGEPFDRLPEIDDDSPIADLLVVAEVIRASMLAFLTPEEIEDQQRSFGFRAHEAPPG